MYIKGNFYPKGFYTGKELLPVLGNILSYYKEDKDFHLFPKLYKIKAICYKRDDNKEEFILYTIYYDRNESASINNRKISFAEYCDLQELWR